jgi:hypothetical protein
MVIKEKERENEYLQNHTWISHTICKQATH